MVGDSMYSFFALFEVLMNPYASLNSNNWTDDPETVIASVFDDYRRCEYSATKLYYGRIRSLPYQIMKYTDERELAAVVQADLEFLYKCHFDAVECTVQYIEENQTTSNSRYRLSISLVCIDGVKRYDLAETLFVSNRKIVSLEGAS